MHDFGHMSAYAGLTSKSVIPYLQLMVIFLITLKYVEQIDHWQSNVKFLRVPQL